MTKETNPSAASPPFRLGVVRYLNTVPLIEGLEGLSGLVLRHEVPARLCDLLVSREVDMALCSSIDFARCGIPVEIVPVGALGCHGETLTVRLFARRSLEAIGTLDADEESHTSIALARVLLGELHGVKPEVRLWRDRPGSRDWSLAGDALLLIGDKAVLHAPPEKDFPVRLDLGEAWAALTGRPFVFAAWMVRADLGGPARARLPAIAAALDHARRHNRDRLDWIVSKHAAPRGWPRDLAKRYLGELLDFEWNDRQAESLETFLDLARAHGAIDRAPPLAFAAIGIPAAGAR